jgi:hypothetical protein
LLKFLTLDWSERLPHVQSVINHGFLHGDLGGADFLKLAIDRGTVRLFGGEKVIQIQALDLQVGPDADLGLAEVRLLLPNLGGLVGADPELLADGGIA